MYNKIGKQAAKLVSSLELQAVLSNDLKLWSIGDNSLQRSYKFRNFEDTWAFLNQIAMRSHLWGHHPTITTTYNKVDIKLVTHDVAGISDIDIKLAKRIESYSEQLQK